MIRMSPWEVEANRINIIFFNGGIIYEKNFVCVMAVMFSGIVTLLAALKTE
jgi:hypothetical protein